MPLSFSELPYRGITKDNNILEIYSGTDMFGISLDKWYIPHKSQHVFSGNYNVLIISNAIEIAK